MHELSFDDTVQCPLCKLVIKVHRVIPYRKYIEGIYPTEEENTKDLMVELLAWYQGKGDEYRNNTLIVDCVDNFLGEK